MRKYFTFISFFLVFGLFLSACGGGGSDGSVGDVTSATGETGRIEGNISSLNASIFGQKKTFFTFLGEFMSLTQTAIAQDGEFCGIVVMVEKGGEVIATAETECDGSFVIADINPGEALLVFQIQSVNMSLPVNIPPGGTVEITLSLEDFGIQVKRLNVISGPVNCDDGMIELGGEGVDEIVIEGDGRNCLNTEGMCEVNLISKNIELKGCNFCIRATENSNVLMIADGGEVHCDASDDGINTNGNSYIGIEASVGIDINSSGEDGIDASGNSVVSLRSKICHIRGFENSIIEDTEDNVNTEECEELTDDDSDVEDMEDETEEEPVEPAVGACEFDCIEDDCELFCSDGIPAECVDLCRQADNFSLCIQECTGFECGDTNCDEFCVEEMRSCEVEEECEEVCGDEPVCEEVCVERECLEFVCEEICVERECLEFACEEVCEGEGEQEVCEEVCSDDCVEFGECLRFEEECGDDCVEFGECLRFEEECECENEVPQCEEVEVCDEICVREALGCRFECEEVI